MRWWVLLFALGCKNPAVQPAAERYCAGNTVLALEGKSDPRDPGEFTWELYGRSGAIAIDRGHWWFQNDSLTIHNHRTNVVSRLSYRESFRDEHQRYIIGGRQYQLCSQSDDPSSGSD